MQFCKKCGAPLNGSAFCTHCGAPAQPQGGGFNLQGILVPAMAFWLGTLFAAIAALIVLFTGFGNIKYINMMESGFATFMFIIFIFIGVVGVAAIVFAAIKKVPKLNKKGVIIAAALLILFIICVIVRGSITSSLVKGNFSSEPSGFAMALFCVPGISVGGMALNDIAAVTIIFNVLAIACYVAGLYCEKNGITSINDINRKGGIGGFGGMNNGGMNNGGMNNGGFNNGGMNNGGF